MDALMVFRLSENIDIIERIERMISMAGAYRNAMVREIERHRSALRPASRRTELEGNEYRVG